MRSIYVKGDPIDAAFLIGVAELKGFNHAVKIHNDKSLAWHQTIDLTTPNATSMLDHLVADALSNITLKPNDPKFITIAQKQYLEWQMAGYPDVDTPMVPLLNTIANTEVLCPMHSCTGHVNQEQKQTRGYVTITGEVHTLLYLEQILVSLIKQMPECKWLTMQRSSIILPLGETLMMVPFICYPVLTIRWYGKTQELLDSRYLQVVELLSAACKDITAKRMD